MNDRGGFIDLLNSATYRAALDENNNLLCASCESGGDSRITPIIADRFPPKRSTNYLPSVAKSTPTFTHLELFGHRDLTYRWSQQDFLDELAEERAKIQFEFRLGIYWKRLKQIRGGENNDY